MITVLYICKTCGADKAKAFVRDRKPEEDILHWMEEVKQAVTDAHSLHSPKCIGKTCDLMIPTDNERGIGYAR